MSPGSRSATRPSGAERASSAEAGGSRIPGLPVKAIKALAAGGNSSRVSRLRNQNVRPLSQHVSCVFP
jgi:hypothetical protein